MGIVMTGVNALYKLYCFFKLLAMAVKMPRYKKYVCSFTAPCFEGSVRLVPEQVESGEIPSFYDDPEGIPGHYLTKQQVSTGRVEVCIQGTYGTVCDAGWGNKEASVICNELGFSPYGKSTALDNTYIDQ